MTKIYESPDKGATVYARDFGQAQRIQVGCVSPQFDPRTSDGRPLIDEIRESKMWGEIRRMAKTNPALQAALDRVIIVYHLSKEDGNSKT
jgi:hypothetical protein